MAEDISFSGLGTQVFIGKKKDDGTVEDLCTVNVKAESAPEWNHEAERTNGGFGARQGWNVAFQLVDEYEEDVNRAQELFRQLEYMQEEHSKIILLHGRRRKAFARKAIRDLKAFRKEIESMNLHLPFYQSNPTLAIDRALEELVIFIKGECTLPTWVQVGKNCFVPGKVHVKIKNGKVTKELSYDESEKVTLGEIKK